MTIGGVATAGSSVRGSRDERPRSLGLNPNTLGRMRAFIGSLIIALLAPFTARAQDFDFYAHGPYRSDVPRPSSLLDYEPGEFLTDYGNMLRVVDAIAEAASDRVRVFVYGRSVEGRPLRLVVISAPRNIARLDEIRAGIESLRDPRSTSPAEAAEIARAMPAVGWMNYANDGNETAAFEAAMQVAYQLAAGEDTMTQAILENVITVINPAHNPESHERHVAWYNAFGAGDSTHIALEHVAPWGMSTNNNHYQFDLNRDALAISQRETKAIVAAHLEWNPQVFVDYHGQTNQFFMPPPMLPINPSLPADQIVRWTEIYGRGNSAAFDRYGWNYYVRDRFDLHYPGYWDSWPALNGATGMTYETDGGGYRGYAWGRDDGTVLTFRDGIAKHFTASLATLRTTAEHREARLRDYYEFFRTGMEELAAERSWKRFVIVPGADPERAARLVEILLRNRIEVSVATGGFTARAAHDYLAGQSGRREFPAGSYVVDLAQPQARMVDALLAPDAEMDPEFIERQLGKRAINARRGANAAKERYEFYDITGWSLPLSFGVEAYWLEEAGRISSRAIDVEFDETATPWRPPVFTGVRDLDWMPAALREGIDGGVRGGRARTAYVFRYDRNASARLLVALMNEGFKVAVATQPLRAGGNSYPRGTMVVRVSRNPEALHGRIAELAARFGVPVDAIDSAYTDEGAVGVGGERVVSLRAPRVAVLAGQGVRATGYGHIWYLLAHEFGLPFTAVRPENLRRLRLKDFDVVILPPGSPDSYRRQLGEDGAEALGEWVRSGGVLIGIAGGAEFLADPELELTSARVVGRESEEEEEDGEREAEAPQDLPPAHGAQLPPLVSSSAGERKPIAVPGTIMRASLDPTHPLTFGYEVEAIAVFVRGDDFYLPSEKGSNPAAFVGDSLRLSGFVWPGNTERLIEGTAWMVDEPQGGGRVILFADDPNFRLLWPSLSRLFLNAILIGPTVR